MVFNNSDNHRDGQTGFEEETKASRLEGSNSTKGREQVMEKIREETRHLPIGEAAKKAMAIDVVMGYRVIKEVAGQQRAEEAVRERVLAQFQNLGQKPRPGAVDTILSETKRLAQDS